ncbi:MAG: TonB-dependent receptor [Candidatus Omnitrophota bacterium]
MLKSRRAVIMAAGGLAVVFFTGTSSFAEKIKLEKIVVTPSRMEERQGDSPRRIEVITRADIEASGAKDLSDVLTNLPSVDITDYGGLGAQKSVRMRGANPAQVLIMIDSRPLNSPRDGQVDLSSIPLDNIDRIEVVYGPSSSLYGSQAMGGTINIITKEPPKERQKTESTTVFGSYKEFSETFSHGGRFKALGYMVSGNYQEDHGFRENSEFNSKDLNAKLEYDIRPDNTLTFNSGVYQSRAGAPGSTTMPSSVQKQKTYRSFYDLGWNYAPDATTDISVKAYQINDRLEFIYNTAPFVNDVQTTKVSGINAQIAQEFYSIYKLLMGIDYAYNFNDSTTSAKHNYNVWAFYMDNQIELFKRLKLTAGARVDRYSNFGSEISPSFTGLYKINDENSIRASLGRSFRAPTFNDLYWPNDGWVSGNPALRPERGWTVEAGYDTRISDIFSAGITYYRSSFLNLINWVQQAVLWQPTNINSAVINGIEVQGKVVLTGDLELDSAYTYLRAKDGQTNKYLIYQPVSKVDIALKYKDKNGLICDLTGQFVDHRFHDPANNIKVKKFFNAKLSVSKKFKEGFTYFVTLENLFNARYQVVRDYPVPLFSMSGGIKAEF